MDVHVLDHPTSRCRIVAPSGQLDMETAPQLRAALDDLIAAGERRIVMDLERLTFCDSTGLSTLIVAQRRCAADGGFLRVARPTRFLLDLITVLGVRDAVGVYDNVEAACLAPR